MTSKDLLKIFQELGFDSTDTDPYIYEDKGSIGIYYSFIDDNYGNLNRLYFPKTLGDAQNFLYKLSWYKNNINDKKITIRLSDYQVIDPEIFFYYDNEKVTVKTIKKYEKDNPGFLKEKKYLERIKRTCTLLLEIIKVKIGVQNETYKSGIKLLSQYKDKMNEYHNLTKDYLNEELLEVNTELEDVNTYDNELLTINKEIANINDKDIIEKYIYRLIDFLKSLETNKDFIENKYELIKIPLKIEELDNKIKYLYTYNNKIINKHDINKIKEELDNISNSSTINTIVSLNNYIDNEIKRINEKYSVVNELDIRTVADYFIEFDNLNIRENVGLDKDISSDKVISMLNESYNNRTNEDKNILILYHSILKKIRIYYSLNNQELLFNSVKDLREVLNNPNNILITIKYFKNINLTSVDNTVSSLNDELEKIKNIKDEELVSDITVYFKCSKYLDDVKYIEASSKSSLAPSLKLEDNELNYIVKLKKGSKIYYIPDSISYDVMEDDLLILKNKEPYFIIDMEKNKIINKNSDIIKVVNYTCKLIKKDDYSCMSDYKNTKVSRYINIEIGGKDEDE